MSEANRVRRREARARLLRDRAAYDAMSASLRKAMQKNEDRLNESLKRSRAAVITGEAKSVSRLKRWLNRLVGIEHGERDAAST